MKVHIHGTDMKQWEKDPRNLPQLFLAYPWQLGRACPSATHLVRSLREVHPNRRGNGTGFTPRASLQNKELQRRFKSVKLGSITVTLLVHCGVLKATQGTSLIHYQQLASLACCMQSMGSQESDATEQPKGVRMVSSNAPQCCKPALSQLSRSPEIYLCLRFVSVCAPPAFPSTVPGHPLWSPI